MDDEARGAAAAAAMVYPERVYFPIQGQARVRDALQEKLVTAETAIQCESITLLRLRKGR